MAQSAVVPDKAVRWLTAALGVEQPFPWQLALLARLLEGDLPRALDIPTGLGKTSVMAIWLVACACGARLARRLVYVVDRRAVVDQATEVALRLRGLVGEIPDLRESLGIPIKRDLPISTLRGKFADNHEWLANPSSHAIILGTVDMIGSRLLFEGYSVSRKMRPYQAGLLGADTLIVLDEAHLVPSFEKLVASICEGSAVFGAREEKLRRLVPPLRLISLSATGRVAHDLFGLTPADEDHGTVRQRLRAKKRVVIRDAVDTEDVKLPEVLAKEAWDLCASGTQPLRCIVFCNSRDDAQAVRAALDVLKAQENTPAVEIETQLFVGGRRVHEREVAAVWLAEHGFLAGHPTRPTKPTFVVATSAAEVGVDLDADHMVCDLVAWERMVQRLGRVNRRGEGDAWVIVVPTLPGKKTRAALDKQAADRSADERSLVTRHEIVQAAARVLQALPRDREGHDASPGALRALKQQAQHDAELATHIEAATTPEPLYPALTRPLLEAWSMTSLREHAGRPEVGPWLRGWVDELPQTTIVWRDHLPISSAGSALRREDVAAYFEAAPAHTLELLETETYRVLKWLIKRLESLHEQESANPGASESTSAVAASTTAQPRPLVATNASAFLIPADGSDPEPIDATRLKHNAADKKRWEEHLGRRLPGAVLVVDTRLGGLVDGLLDERSPSASDVAALRDDLPVRVVATTQDRSTDPDWREEIRFAIHVTEEGLADRWLAIQSRRDAEASTEEGRSVSRAQLLDEHQSWTERRARELATKLLLPDAYIEMLALAGRLHDEGKRARRWQRAFNAPSDGVYGKTVDRPNITLLDGYRHEFGSLLRVETDARIAALDDPLRELCLHLIAAHHGSARPTIRTSGCEEAPPSALVARAQAIALRFARLERRWGPWGLAWWEALLRSADQQASRDNDRWGDEVGE